MIYRLIPLLCLLSASYADPASHLAHKQWTTQGLKVYYLHDNYLPMLDIQLLSHAGAASTAPGVAYLTNQLLNKGSHNLSQQDIARDFDAVGALYTHSVHHDYALSGLRVLTRTDYLNKALKTWQHMLAHPLFPKKQRQMTQARMLVMYRSLQQSPRALNQQALMQALYPHHPYGHLRIGQPKDFIKITDQPLKDFYQHYYRAKNSVLVIVGDVSEKKAHQISERIARVLPKGPAPIQSLAFPKRPQATERIQTFQATQASVSLGQLGISVHDPRKLPLTLGTYILGGHMHSLLQEALRNKRGLTYGVHSYFATGAQPGPFVITLQTKANQAQLALKLAQETTEHFLKTGPSKQQVQRAKQRLTTAFHNQMASASGQINGLKRLAIYGLPQDYLTHYLIRLNQITPQQIQQAMQQTLKPKHWIRIIVQPKPTQTH